MSRFDLYATSNPRSFLLDVQSDLLDIPSTRMVAPVLPERDVPPSIRGLHPRIEHGDEHFVMATHLMAAVPHVALGPVVGNMARQADEITRALDLLFQGY